MLLLRLPPANHVGFRPDSYIKTFRSFYIHFLLNIATGRFSKSRPAAMLTAGGNLNEQTLTRMIIIRKAGLNDAEIIATCFLLAMEEIVYGFIGEDNQEKPGNLCYTL